jgi:hypothetical protein
MVMDFSAQTTGQKKVEKSCLTVLRGYAMMGHMKRETGNENKETTIEVSRMQSCMEAPRPTVRGAGKGQEGLCDAPAGRRSKTAGMGYEEGKKE